MGSYNLLVLMGNLTRDVELSYTPSQVEVANFGIAVNKKYTDKDGEKHESVMFIDCVAFKGTAKTINKYMGKGDPILINGELQFDTWTAKDGTKRSKHKMLVRGFQFIDKSEKSGANPDHVGDNPAKPTDDIPF